MLLEFGPRQVAGSTETCPVLRHRQAEKCGHEDAHHCGVGDHHDRIRPVPIECSHRAVGDGGDGLTSREPIDLAVFESGEIHGVELGDLALCESLPCTEVDLPEVRFHHWFTQPQQLRRLQCPTGRAADD